MKLYSWGANSYGQLGLGHKSEQELQPTIVNLDNTSLKADNIVGIAGGGGHTLILDNKGVVYACGWNSKGQLGLSDDTLKFQPLDVITHFKIVQVACGFDFSAALTDNGKLLVWGSNAFNQIGLAKSITCTGIPSLLQFEHSIKKISCGLRHMTILTSENIVLCSGVDSKGQLGAGDSKITATGFGPVPELTDASHVSSGHNHSIVAKNDGNIIGWGENKWGQLGQEKNTPNTTTLVDVTVNKEVEQLASGWTHNVILTKSGELWNWGRNNYGQLGTEREKNWIPEKLSSLSNVKSISLGSEHNLAVTNNGELYVWGWNEHGNCGTGDTKNVLKPKQIFANEKVVLAAAGSGHNFVLVE